PAGAAGAESAAGPSESAAPPGKTTVACFLGIHAVHDELTSYLADEEGNRVPRTVPSYVGPEDAVWALARATDYSRWRAADHGRYIELDDLDDRKVRSIIESALAGAEPGTPVRLERDDTRALLNAYGI